MNPNKTSGTHLEFFDSLPKHIQAIINTIYVPDNIKHNFDSKTFENLVKKYTGLQLNYSELRLP